MAKEDWSKTALADKARDRKSRLARALKDNLKRRKAGSAAGTADSDASAEAGAAGLGAGTAPQKGLNRSPPVSPKTASKRN